MEEKLRNIARERMQGHCHVCPRCDGKTCAGMLPGMGGLGSGSSFRANVEALDRVKLAMRCLHTAAQPDLSTELLGLRLSLPVLAAPIGGVAFNMGMPPQNPVDETAYAKAVICGCHQSGILGCGGDGVSPSIIESALAAVQACEGQGIPFVKPWAGDFLRTRLEMALASGCPVLGMDVDAAGLITLRLQGRPISPKSGDELAEIARFVHEHGVKFMVKGIMTMEDARVAMDAGVDALVVSNHGGRVLDGTPGTAEVLPDIAAAVGGRIPLLVDGGVRTGTDVLKMLALGAQAVLIGRPFTIAAMGGGREGVVAYIAELKNALASAMALTGCANMASIGPHILA